MATYIALLRGVNIGGNTLKMERLRALCADLGFENIRTYVQSGNVLFENAGTVAACKKALEDKLLGQTRLPVTVIVRKPADMRRVLGNNPFPDVVASDMENSGRVGSSERARLYVAFLAAAPGREKMQTVRKLQFGQDRFHIAGKEIYLRYAQGYGNSKMNNNVFEKVLGIRATTRNWNTIKNLWKLASV